MAEIKARAPGDGDSPYIYPDPVDPNLSNIGTEVKIFRLNPDGTKGELIRIDPAFPDGWENPRFNVSPKKRKEVDEVAAKPRKDRAEITRKVRALMEEGMTLKKAAEEAGVPVTTVYTWLEQDKKTPKKRQAEKSAEPEQGQPVPADYKNINCMKRIDEYAMNNELAKLKIDFANLTLLSTLNDTMKLKVIEYIVRM